jgi:NTE family protein
VTDPDRAPARAARNTPVEVPQPQETLAPNAIQRDEPQPKPKPGLALCLSGGGSRAMLFHAGALIRLNEAGLLKDLDCVSSVSGGSIAAGALAVAWKDLAWTGDHATNLVDLVVKPLSSLAGKRIDITTWIIGTILPGQTPATRFADQLDKHLYHGTTLDQLPKKPLFVFNATNLASCVLWVFSHEEMGDYRVGKIKNPAGVRVATAVAASSAFPPAYAPLRLEFADGVIAKPSGRDALDDDAFRRSVPLGDGGIYDNLGMEFAWKRYGTVLVSDGGGETAANSKPALDPPRQIVRVMQIIDRQVRSLRKRTLIAGFKSKPPVRLGTFWGIRTAIADYELDDVLPCPVPATLRLAEEPTRLWHMPIERQRRLMNWGYAVCDAALRKHVLRDGRKKGAFPFPGGIG